MRDQLVQLKDRAFGAHGSDNAFGRLEYKVLQLAWRNCDHLVSLPDKINMDCARIPLAENKKPR